MFLGTHNPKLDEKGRLILPAKFRDGLGDGLVMTKGQERCIVIWPAESFQEYAESLRARSTNNEKVRAYTRVFFSSAFDDVADKQGRVTVPSQLRDYAGLTKELVVIGNNTHLEIWDLHTWNTYLSEKESSFSDISEGVLPPT
jgi:MraZ protein